MSPFRKPFENRLLSSCKSVYNCLTTRFVHNTNLATAWNYGHPVHSESARSVQKTPAGTPKNEHPCSFLGYKFAGANLLLLGTTDIPVRDDTLSIYFCTTMAVYDCS